MGKTDRPLTTYERMMKDPARRREFDEGYREFLISELLIALMEKDHISVRKLAVEARVSPSIIQDLRSGKRKNTTLRSFLSIMHSLGAEISIRKGRDVVAAL